MIALKSPAKSLIPLAVPDSLYWLLEDVPQHTLLLILPGVPMPERCKTTREHIPARSNVGQCVGTSTARPGTIPKIPYQALQGRGGACRIEDHATFLTHLLTSTHQLQFFARGTAEQALFRVGQPSFEEDESLHIDLAYAMLVCQIDKRRQFAQVSFHSGEPQGDGRFARELFLLNGSEGADVAPDFIEGVYTAHPGIRLTRRAVHRETIFIQPSLDQFLAPLRIEQDAVGVKQHIGSACFEIANHARQLFVEQWLTQTVQHHALQLRKLIHDGAKVVEGEIAVILAREQRARALLAPFVASTGRFNVDRAWQCGCSHTNSFIVAKWAKSREQANCLSAATAQSAHGQAGNEPSRPGQYQACVLLVPA